jgi:hypothetical protein
MNKGEIIMIIKKTWETKPDIYQDQIEVIEENKNKGIAKYKSHEFAVEKVNDKWLPV